MAAHQGCVDFVVRRPWAFSGVDDDFRRIGQGDAAKLVRVLLDVDGRKALAMCLLPLVHVAIQAGHGRILEEVDVAFIVVHGGVGVSPFS